MLPDEVNSELDALYDKIKVLNEGLWEGRVDRPALNHWLENFTGLCTSVEEEKRHALYLLSKFLYFGQVQVRELLRAMFQDLFRHHLTVKIREQQANRNDFANIHKEFLSELSQTRFIGLGNPAESGTHILYDFRIVNNLPLDYFANTHELFTGALNDTNTKWALQNVKRIVFIDDFCGTGHQATDLGEKFLPVIRYAAHRSGLKVEVWYLSLLATTKGLTYLRGERLFDHVECVSELDETYRVFDDSSQIYEDPATELSKADAESIVKSYGKILCPFAPLGYGDCQLLLGFHHNVPDNTLPIFWRQETEPNWYAVFPRGVKY